MDKNKIVIFFSAIKRRAIDVHNNMDEPQIVFYFQNKKSGKIEYILYNTIYIKIWKMKINL